MTAALAGFLNGFADQKKAQKADKEREIDRQLRREEIAAADRASERGAQAARAGRSLPADVGGYGTTSAPHAPAIPAGERAAYIRAGLIERGLPEHVADGFLLNFQDESGLDAGIEERTPNKHGTRGFGLYQLTGPRRTAYEAAARARGVAPSDIDMQLDFMVGELHGPESKAWSMIQAAPDTGTAAAAIVDHFLRPAREHEKRRMAKYLGQPAPAAAPATSAPAPGIAKPRMLPVPDTLQGMPDDIRAQAPGTAMTPRSFSITPGAATPWATFGKAIA